MAFCWSQDLLFSAGVDVSVTYPNGGEGEGEDESWLKRGEGEIEGYCHVMCFWALELVCFCDHTSQFS